MGVHAIAGQVVEASKAEASALVAVGRAEPAGANDKLTPEGDLLRTENLDPAGRHPKDHLERLGLGPEAVDDGDPEVQTRDPKSRGKGPKAD